MRWLAGVLAAVLPMVLAAALSGCSSVGDMFDSKIDYKSASQLPSLEIPPDLTTPARDNRFAMPENPQSATLSGYQQERKEQGRPGASGVLPQVENVRFERAGSERWLVVQEPPERVWPVVREFWQERGFLIKEESPEVGVMETEWAENRAALPQDFVRNLLGRFAEQVYSSSERDKFRTRLDRTPDGKGTEIYIAHRGMREVYTTSERGQGNEGQTRWEPRDPDPGLEAEFLRRLMVRLGTQEERAKLAATQAPQAQRAELRKSSDGSQRLQVNEPFDRAWRRVGLALDRVGFTVEDRDRQKGLYFVRYADPEGDMQKKDAQRGFFSRLFSSGDPKVKAEQYRVQVIPEKETSTVNVLNKDGGAESSTTAQRILTLLHEQLK
jgi:outer membrane protein assembly factor BamC